MMFTLLCNQFFKILVPAWAWLLSIEKRHSYLQLPLVI